MKPQSLLLAAATLAFGATTGSAAPVPCVNGFAGPYPCDSVDMLSFRTLPAVGGGQGNDVWGWTDPTSGREYAILGLTNATSFIDITDPVNPIYIGRLMAPPAGACVPMIANQDAPWFTPDHEDCPSPLPIPASGGAFIPDHCESGDSTWRDVEVYADHAYIGSEQSGHGLVVFDLRRLRAFAPPYGQRPGVTFNATARFCGFGSSHTITINTTTGFLFANGTNTCSGGPHIVDIRNPPAAVSAGCDSADGYTHDSQCFVYQGPDTAHQGKSICINCNGPTDRLVIKDVTNPAAPVRLSTTGYAGSGYPHQGWVTADHRYYLLDDETDEQSFQHNTKTYVWDLLNLDAPQMIGVHLGPTPAIDHQQFIHGSYSYQSNYRAGLRILETENIAGAQLSEVAFFDVYPANDLRGFNGTWANYPFFPSGNVVVTTIENTGFGGFFVLRPQLANLAMTVVDSPDPVVAGQNVTYTFTITNQGPTYSTNATFTDPLPPSLTLVSVTPSQGTCAGTTTITCDLGTIAKGAQAIVTVIAQAGAPGMITNAATVAATEKDTRAADNVGSAQTTVNASIAKRVVAARRSRSQLR